MQRMLRIILFFILPWWAYYIGHGILLGFPQPGWLLPNLLVPSLFLGFAGGILHVLSGRTEQSGRPHARTGTLRILLAVALLVAIDQGIKAYLYSLDWQRLHVTILPGFAIAPVVNVYGSYLASILKTRVPLGAYLVLYITVGFLYFEGFRYYLKSARRSFWVTGAMAAFFGGLLSVFLDNLIHRGSLDYLLIEPLFTCDLKDFYLTFGVIFIFVETVEHARAVKRGEITDTFEFRLRDLLVFILNDVRNLLGAGRKTDEPGKNPANRKEE